MPRKRNLDDHRREAERRQDSARPRLVLVLDNIRSLNNVGAIFRAADGFGVERIYLCGITPSPPRPEIAKISLGAEDAVPYESVADPAKVVRMLQHDGFTVLCAEQTDRSRSIFEADLPHPIALVLGHETEGVDEKVLELADGEVEVPMYGTKHNHNVATCAAILLTEVTRRWRHG